MRGYSVLLTLIALPMTVWAQMPLPSLADLLRQASMQPQRASVVVQSVTAPEVKNCRGWNCFDDVEAIKARDKQYLRQYDNAQVKAAREAGMTELAAQLAAKADFLREAEPLYQRYPILTKAQVEAFNANLRQLTTRITSCSQWETVKGNKQGACMVGTSEYEQLALVPVASYDRGMPPADVMRKLARAQREFDTLEIAYIETVREDAADPLLLGQITGSTDYFVIAQWGADITYNEVLQLGAIDGTP